MFSREGSARPFVLNQFEFLFEKKFGANASQLCNERLRIGCFRVDLEWYALCSHRRGCSAPLQQLFSKLLQPITEQIEKQNLGFSF